MRRQEINGVVVICTRCGQAADYEPASAAHPWGRWLWHQPCKYCGGEAWTSHDPKWDIRTGRIIEEPQK